MDYELNGFIMKFVEAQILVSGPPNVYKNIYYADFSLMFWFLGIIIILLILLLFKRK